MVKGIQITRKKRISVVRPNRTNGGPFTDYKVNQVAMAPVAQNKSSAQTRGNSLRFKECERISTIPGSVAFAVSGSVACNPGLAASFPWLSGHANLFERYRIHKLIYRYKNLKGTASNGNILMSFDYDTLDNPPASAVEMTQSTVYVDGAPWRIFQLEVPTDKRDLFTRSAAVAGADLKTYDMGKLHVAAEGCADATPHGYLEVEYDVELFMKQSITSGSAGVEPGASTAIDTGGGLSQNGLALTTAAGVVSAPAGKYVITVWAKSNGSGSGFLSFAGLSAGTFNTVTNVAQSITGIVTLAVPGVLGTVTASAISAGGIVVVGSS